MSGSQQSLFGSRTLSFLLKASKGGVKHEDWGSILELNPVCPAVALCIAPRQLGN